MDKPTKPTDLIPRSFGGIKNNFSASLQSNGYEPNVPAIYGGDNLNYQLDATGKELDYCEKIVDFINETPIGKTLTVDNNNKLVYANLVSDVSDKANISLSNLNATGQAVIDGKANVALSNLNATGQAIIDNKANISLSNLDTIGNNKVLPSQSGNNGKYLTTNGTSPSWTDFTGANKDLSNLTTVGEGRLHALKGYEENGEVLTDNELLADVIKYATSTYDSLKFNFHSTSSTSVTITTEGTATGFTTNDWITVDAYTFPSTLSNFYIACKFKTGNDITNIYSFLSIGGSAHPIFDCGVYNSNITIPYATTTATTTTATTPCTANTEYTFEAVYNGTSLNLKLNGETFAHPTNFVYNGAEGTIWIGRTHSQSNPYPFNGSVELGSLFIMVDGRVVFNGAKTGMDLFKPDNYTLTKAQTATSSTVTVTTDGLATNFDYANNIQSEGISASLTFNTAVVTGRLICNSAPKTLTGYNQFHIISNSVFIYNTFSSNGVGLSWNGGTRFDHPIAQGEINAGDIIDYECTIDNVNLQSTLKLYKNGTAISVSPQTLPTAQTDIRYKTANNNTISLTNSAFSIDLNAIKIYKDGELIYQPCLKIPYTLTANGKYGSKIVDGYYLNRVKDVYEQNYPQKYYVLDRINRKFALPMGEIYGMISNASNLQCNYLCQVTYQIIERSSYWQLQSTLINHGGFVIGSNTIAIPKTGFYMITFMFPKGLNYDGTTDKVQLQVNENTEYYIVDSSNPGQSITGILYIKLNEGDIVQLYGVNIRTAADTYGYGYMAIQLVGF